jgi:hypothetical protein
MQRRLAGTLAEASIIDAQYRTASPAKEFDIVQVRGEVSRCPRTKQDNRGLLGHLRGHCLSDWSEPKASEELALGVGEGHLVSTETKIGWRLIAIPIRQQDEGIE